MSDDLKHPTENQHRRKVQMNFLNKLFGKKSKQDLRPFITSERTPEQEAMFQEQLRIRDALGFERGNDTQAWLRLHQILLDHDERLKKLECGK